MFLQLNSICCSNTDHTRQPTMAPHFLKYTVEKKKLMPTYLFGNSVFVHGTIVTSSVRIISIWIQFWMDILRYDYGFVWLYTYIHFGIAVILYLLLSHTHTHSRVCVRSVSLFWKHTKDLTKISHKTGSNLLKLVWTSLGI